MKSKHVNTEFVWTDDSIAEVKCPACGERITVVTDEVEDCSCGKRYILSQTTHLREVLK
jgi:hypothetical protein